VSNDRANPPHQEGARGLAARVLMPLGIVQRVPPELIDSGTVTESDRGYLIVNFEVAHLAKDSAAKRALVCREKRKAEFSRAKGSVTKRDEPVTIRIEENRLEETRLEVIPSGTFAEANAAEAQSVGNWPADLHRHVVRTVGS